MDIETSRALKLFFPNSAFVQVFYEAIANAFDAKAERIAIHVESASSVKDPEFELVVTDDGEGFDADNFERFRRIVEPRDAYHKGLGRLVFLHYFERVEVESFFAGKLRRFVFSHSFNGENTEEPVESSPTKRGTTMRFLGFIKTRLRTYEDLKPGSLKERIIEQFFPLLHEFKRAGRPFQIDLSLSTNKDGAQKELLPDRQSIRLADIPDLESRDVSDGTIDAFSKITMWYCVEVGAAKRRPVTAVSVDGRTIPLELLAPNAIPEDCAAVFYFESDMFAGKSDSARQRLSLPDGMSQPLLERVLRTHIAAVLDEHVPVIGERNRATRDSYEALYPHLIGLFETESVGLIDRSTAIEAAQAKFFRQQREVLEGDAADDAVFDKSLEVSARSLTEYILYRDFVIKRLADIPPSARESAVHELIVPRYTTVDAPDLVTGIYRNNAWLLDDKFMTFRTVLSESRMDEVIHAITLESDLADDEERPDISMIFSADPDSAKKVDVVVVELKRRQVDDKDGPYAATQLVRRAQKLVDYCPNIQRVWYYGIIEINNELGRLLQSMNWSPLFSRGHVYYQEYKVRDASGNSVPAPTFLVSFEAVAHDAAARNHAFLELLRSNFRRGMNSSTG